MFGKRLGERFVRPFDQGQESANQGKVASLCGDFQSAHQHGQPPSPQVASTSLQGMGRRRERPEVARVACRLQGRQTGSSITSEKIEKGVSKI